MLLQLYADIDPNLSDKEIALIRDALEKRYPLCDWCALRVQESIRASDRRVKLSLLNRTIMSSAGERQQVRILLFVV